MPLSVYACLTALVFGFTGGWLVNGWRHDAAQNVAAQQVRQVEHAQQATTASIASAFETQREQTRTVYRNINHEVIKYVHVHASDPADCRLPADWVRLHNAAVSGLPNPASQPAAAARATDALVTVTGNYETCRETADRLAALQAWVTAQSRAASQ